MFDKFDPSNKTHVEWLKTLVEADLDKKISILNNNPMGEQIPPFEVIHMIFGLSAKYVKAVFDKTAVIL
jgi:hypothetical protein